MIRQAAKGLLVILVDVPDTAEPRRALCPSMNLHDLLASALQGPIASGDLEDWRLNFVLRCRR